MEAALDASYMASINVTLLLCNSATYNSAIFSAQQQKCCFVYAVGVALQSNSVGLTTLLLVLDKDRSLFFTFVVALNVDFLLLSRFDLKYQM